MWFKIRLGTRGSSSLVSQHLNDRGWQEICVVEIPGESEEIFALGDFKKWQDLKRFPLVDIQSVNPIESEIDWKQQWEEYAPGYKNGYVWINQDNYDFFPSGLSIKLEPGPGFGDCSHTSTRLMLNLLCREAKGQKVLDIGCGSGVLSVASACLGAKQVLGVDVSESILLHAEKNAYLNDQGSQVSFTLPGKAVNQFDPDLVLINMIQSEQEIAWAQSKDIHSSSFRILSSGILEADLDAYLTLSSEWGWAYDSHISLDGWVAITFEYPSQG